MLCVPEEMANFEIEHWLSPNLGYAEPNPNSRHSRDRQCEPSQPAKNSRDRPCGEDSRDRQCRGVVHCLSSEPRNALRLEHCLSPDFASDTLPVPGGTGRDWWWFYVQCWNLRGGCVVEVGGGPHGRAQLI